jgi:hypothetical protein
VVLDCYWIASSGQRNTEFVDDLSILEIINLLTIGMSSFHKKSQVPYDIPTHGQYIESSNLKSQHYLNKINKWTEEQAGLSRATLKISSEFYSNFSLRTHNSQSIERLPKYYNYNILRPSSYGGCLHLEDLYT